MILSVLSNNRNFIVSKLPITNMVIIAARAYGLSANDVVKVANIFEKSISLGGMKNTLAENAPRKLLLNFILLSEVLKS